MSKWRKNGECDHGCMIFAGLDGLERIVSLAKTSECYLSRMVTRHRVIHINKLRSQCSKHSQYDDVMKWKHFPRYWPFVWGIHRLPVNSPHKGRWRGALMFYLICAWTNVWVNNRDAGDFRRHCAHYYVTTMTANFFKMVHNWHLIAGPREREARVLLCV